MSVPGLWLDASTGVSGDMFLAALLDAGAPLEVLQEGLDRLRIPGLRVEAFRRDVASIQTLGVRVRSEPQQPLRRLDDLLSLLERSRLDVAVLGPAREALVLLGQAEAAVHGASVDEIHFHEIGAVDTVADVLGAFLLWDALGRPRTRCSPVNLGSGFVDMAHGRLPVPAPAVAELARNAIPVFSTPTGGETATPTGMAVLRALCADFGPLPPCRVQTVGYGSGARSGDAFPTFLRAFVLAPVSGQSL